MAHENYDIRDVGIYLRKSRGDEEKDLINHEIILTDLCNKYNWKYTKYFEIGTSDSIDLRPQMQELLIDIQANLFDAILVVDEDRLSRGDIIDQATIKQDFFSTGTYLVTPTKVYDFSKDEDDFMHDLSSLFSRYEYNTINKRFQLGKKIGARRGNWTNGTPPFPYEYERYKDKYNKNGLVVNDEKLITYRFIIEEALNNTPPDNIAWELNKREILSPRNTMWTGTTIHRILIDETHLGKIISNKGKGDSHANKKRNAIEYTRLPKSEWIIVDNCHEKVKTLNEHNKILTIIKKRKKSPTRLSARIYTFSGLIKCSNCESGMSYAIKKDAAGNNVEYLKPCWKTDSYGKKCINRGIKINRIETLLHQEILKYKQNIINRIESNNTEDISINNLFEKFTITNKNIEKYYNALDRVNDSYELGAYTREEWLVRKQKWKHRIDDLELQLEVLETKMERQISLTDEEQLKRVEHVIKNLTKTKDLVDKNLLLKTIIDNITYRRLNDDEIDIEVIFL